MKNIRVIRKGEKLEEKKEVRECDNFISISGLCCKTKVEKPFGPN